MQNSSQPKLIPTPFADNGARQNIPNDSQIGITAGRASYTDGFPPLTRTPLAAGGVPPFGTDFNGVLNDITAAVRWSQSGAGYTFNSAFNTAISGYPKGARIPNSTLDGYWLNTTDGNTANPEVTGAATTGWVPAESYGVTAITGLSGSSVTLTTLQASKERITLAGTLSANINLVLPAWIKRWVVVNNCAGAFSVTVKTPNGNGVPVASGATAILQGDGTDITLAASPGSLLGLKRFTSSGTYIPSIGARNIIVEIVGGGGGGGGASAGTSTSNSVAGGGGSGAYAKLSLPVSFSSVSISIGAGGTGGTAGNTGGSGGDTSFGSYITSGGGTGGYSATANNASNAAGGGFGGNVPVISGATVILSMGGGFGQPGYMMNGQGGNAGNGANSMQGMGGYGAATSGTGSSGRGYGSGGGGSLNTATASSGRPGGDGTPGLVIVWEYS